jgi:hypothetical protein
MSTVVATAPLTTRPLRFGAAISLAVTAGLLLLTSRATPVEWFPLIVLAAAAVIAITVHRPAVGCALLVVGAALTAGLGRNTVVPALRTSEALTLLVAAGTVLREIGRRQRYSLFDVVVLIYALGAVLVPSGYMWVTGTSASVDAWRTILGPLQFLLIYFVFSRARLDGVEVAEILRLAMFTSVLIAVVAMAQVADVPGVRSFIETFYSGNGEAANICNSGPCRATSLLEHYSGLGAFAVLHYTLALVLCAYAPGAFSGRWLTLVMALNAVAAFISGTQAAMLGLGLATIVCVLHARRLPRQLVLMIAPLALGLLFFWNQIQLRIEQQFSGPGGVLQAGTPESLDVRARYWTEIFVPLLKEHLWFGTGSVIPAEVPERLVNFVDNQYLGLGFRAGLVGELLLALMLIGVVVAGWRYRRSDESLNRAVGGAVAAFAVVLAVIGTTAEYLTFAGVAQAFWMLVGIMAGWKITSQAEPANLIVLGSSEPKKRHRRLA